MILALNLYDVFSRLNYLLVSSKIASGGYTKQTVKANVYTFILIYTLKVAELFHLHQMKKLNNILPTSQQQWNDSSFINQKSIYRRSLLRCVVNIYPMTSFVQSF